MKTDKEILEVFAENVKRLRKAKGVTQQEAYDETNIHFGRIEQGNRDVSLTTLVKVAEYLECGVEELV
jgi:transcriptional regulator with XRE-family HTH domain